MQSSSKVTVIGPGSVGMVVAYTLMLRQLAKEVVLIGRDQSKAEGEAMDLMHAQAFLNVPVKVKAGSYKDAAGSDVVVICASIPTPENITDRNQLARGNAKLMQELLPPIVEVAPDCKILVVTNPVDVMTSLAIDITGFPAERVFGTGTLIDSIRFRELLSEMLDVHPDDLRAYILGEHGEQQFPAMSVAQVAGEKIDDQPERRALCEDAKRLGIEVFRRKGNTCYAIGLAVVYVLESILMNERRTIPLSIKINGFLGVSDVCLSLPVVIGKNGIERYIHPSLNDAEKEAFRVAAREVKKVILSLRDEPSAH